jgi:predicted CXXCH cytochrome family protein
MRRTVLLAVGLLAVAGGATVLRLAQRETPAPVQPPPPATLPTIAAVQRSPAELARAAADSNILPSDYVGAKACESCHKERYAQWSQHPHSRMNQDATSKSIMGNFDNAHIALPQGDVTFKHVGDAYTMTLARAGKTVRSYRVTRTVGSRFMQFYIGKQVEGPEPKTSTAYTEEQKLPYGYLFRSKRWLPHNYFDALGPEVNADGHAQFEPFDSPQVHLWASSCMQCHNTVPYAYRTGFVAPRMGYPIDDLVRPLALRDVIAKTVDLSRTPNNVLYTGNALVPDRDLAALGVSCEACHFGGRVHVAAEGEAGSWTPVSNLLEIKPRDQHHVVGSDPKNPYVVNAICTQCHSANAQTFANGAGVANSREALDMLAGACNPQIKCTDCHDPHITNGPDGQPASTKQLGACLKCHDKYADPAAAAAHSRHSGNPEVTCLDCHMPRISQGLDQIVRSHRISSPSDRIMLSSEQPNACNLCHLDKSIAWTVGELNKGWGTTLHVGTDPTLGLPAGRAWLAANSPFVRLAATQAWGRSPLGRTAVPDLIRALEDPHAVNRVFATFAVERVLGAPLTVADYDPTATIADRADQIARLLKRVAPAKDEGK